MAVVTDIRDELVAAVASVSVAGNFNTDNVTTANRLVPASDLNADELRAHFAARYVGKAARKAGNATIAQARFTCLAKMANVTDEAFANFLEDIEAVIDQRDLTQVNGTYHGMTSIVSYEEDLTDVAENTEDRLHECEITIVIEYHYSPENLSGV